MTEKIPIDVIAPCVEKLRTLRPDDNISGFDAFDNFVVPKKKIPEEECRFLSEMEELFRPIKNLKTELITSRLKKERMAMIPTDEILVCYLAHLDKYLSDSFLTRKKITSRYQVLWDQELLQKFTPDQMLLIHWSVAAHRKSAHPHSPRELLEIFLCAEKIIPLCYRRWYSSFYPMLMRIKEMNNKKSFRTESRGDFNRYQDRWGKENLSDALKQAIQQDSIGAAEINLTLLNKQWSAGFFGYAATYNATNILRHIIRRLKPDAKGFSSYDAIIYIILNLKTSPLHDPRLILRLFEEEFPGILSAYRDPYGNTLLRIVLDLAWKSPKQAKLYRDFLLEYGCNPDEPNALGITYRNVSYYLTGQF